MNNDGTYVWLYRRITDRTWYRNIPVKTLFIHCIIKANWADKQYECEVVKRGTFVTSIRKLADETGLTERQVRTALDVLIDNKMIEKIPSQSKTLVIVLNYDLYQKNHPNCAILATHKTTQCATHEETQCASTDEPLDKGQFICDTQYTTHSMTQQTTHETTTTNKYIKNNKEKRYAQMSNNEPQKQFDKECAFKKFWNLYPKKKDKKRAHDKFIKLCKDEKTFNEIFKGLNLQMETVNWKKNNGQYIPYPSSWLNGELWNDEVGTNELEARREVKVSDW